MGFAKPQRKSVWTRFQSQFLTWFPFMADPAATETPEKNPTGKMSKDVRISAQCGYYEQDSSWAISDKKSPKNSNLGLPFRTGFASEARVTDSSCYEATKDSLLNLSRLASDLILGNSAEEPKSEKPPK